MNVYKTKLKGVVIIEPKVFEDDRGFFIETFQKKRYFEMMGMKDEIVQANHSRSTKGTLRGLHYQVKKPQAKLLRVVAGEIFDVAVDLRKGSETFGQWASVTLSAENKKQIYVPVGMAHGFCVLSDTAEIEYKCTEFYYPEHERTILWNDPDIGVEWPITAPILSKKDAEGLPFSKASYFD